MPAGTLARAPDGHIRGVVKSGFKKAKINFKRKTGDRQNKNSLLSTFLLHTKQGIENGSVILYRPASDYIYKNGDDSQHKQCMYQPSCRVYKETKYPSYNENYGD